MEILSQFYQCFEAITLFVCIFLALKSINQIIELYEYIKLQIASNKINNIFEDVVNDAMSENTKGKHSKEE